MKRLPRNPRDLFSLDARDLAEQMNDLNPPGSDQSTPFVNAQAARKTLHRLQALEAGIRGRRQDSVPAPRPSLDWAAGLLDGDGCISIVRQTYPHRASTLRLTVSISQNCRETLEHFQASAGIDGAISNMKRRPEHNKQVYVLNYAGPGARALIERLRPCLYRKRHEAAVALDFCELGQISRRFGPAGVPPHLQALRETYYKKLQALK